MSNRLINQIINLHMNNQKNLKKSIVEMYQITNQHAKNEQVNEKKM